MPFTRAINCTVCPAGMVVAAVMAGRSTQEIARSLVLSSAAIKRDLGDLFKTFGVGSRLELAAFGAELGIRPARLSTTVDRSGTQDLDPTPSSDS